MAWRWWLVLSSTPPTPRLRMTFSATSPSVLVLPGHTQHQASMMDSSARSRDCCGNQDTFTEDYGNPNPNQLEINYLKTPTQKFCFRWPLKCIVVVYLFLEILLFAD